MPNSKNAVILALQFQFEQSQWWSPEALLEQQMRQTENLVAHLSRNVPFCAGRFEAISGLQRGNMTMADFRRIPLLKRADIQDAGAAMYSRKLPPQHGPATEITTSGSTGQPVTVKFTMMTHLISQAINLRYHDWHRRDFTGKMAALVQVKTPSGTSRSKRWVQGYASGPVHSFDISRPLEQQMAWLEKQDPDYLVTYPTNLQAILRRCEESGFRPPRLRSVSTMSEVLEPEVRALCERVWQVPLSDAYSAREAGCIALQCPDHPHYHVQSESVLVEILDDDGNPCSPGETGRVVVTDLHNFATALVRYECGDYAEVGEPCPCGRGLPVLNRIMGRTRNMLVLPSGDQIWPRLGFPRFPDIAPIRQAQVIQKSVDTLEARLVTARPLVADEERRLGDMIRDYLGFPVNVVFSYHDEIPRSASGKYEEFLSEVAAP